VDRDNIKTSRDVANLLEEVVELLRTIPELPLSDIGRNPEPPNEPTRNRKNSNHKQGQRPLSDLASRLPALGRENAKAEIQSLTIKAMRELAASLEIRIPSRATKSETVNILMAQVFDVPAGHERIRTFHKRNISS
jgi:hypothetical protein